MPGWTPWPCPAASEAAATASPCGLRERHLLRVRQLGRPAGRRQVVGGDSKIVAPDGRVLRLADNEHEAVLVADLDLSVATRKYALDSLEHPRFLTPHWRRLVREIALRAKTEGRFELPPPAEE